MECARAFGDGAFKAMAGAKLQAASLLYPARRTLIARLAARSSQFRALCSDLDDVSERLASDVNDEDRLEYARLFQELSKELGEWIGPED